MEERLVAMEAENAGEHGGEVRDRLGLAEESRSSFEKTHLRTLTNLASNAVDGAVEEVDDKVEEVDGMVEKVYNAHCVVEENDCC
jgi:hypothetical protein